MAKHLEQETRKACKLKGVPFSNAYLKRVKTLYLQTPANKRQHFTLFERKSEVEARARLDKMKEYS